MDDEARAQLIAQRALERPSRSPVPQRRSASPVRPIAPMPRAEALEAIAAIRRQLEHTSTTS